MAHTKTKGPLKAARMASHLSLDELGERIGKTPQTVLAKERNPKKMTIEEFEAIYDSVSDDGKMILERFINDIFLR